MTETAAQRQRRRWSDYAGWGDAAGRPDRTHCKDSDKGPVIACYAGHNSYTGFASLGGCSDCHYTAEQWPLSTAGQLLSPNFQLVT